MTSKLFVNAINRIEQPTPPIWFMRQAGRYHNHYQKLKEQYSFEELCKIPDLASEVACGPVNEFDFDLAILFSDILFILEGLGMDLSFNPGPILNQNLNQDNFKKFQDIEKAISFLEFQKKALEITRKKLPDDKSLIGFVGGPWTVLRYALGKNTVISLDKDLFIYTYLEKTLIPLLKKNIDLQIQGGAEVVMILDSGLDDISTLNLEIYLKNFLSELAANSSKNIGYYAKKNYIEAEKHLRKAVELLPLDPVINDHYADALWMLNKSIQARYFWKNILKLEDIDKDLKDSVSKKLLFGITKKL